MEWHPPNSPAEASSILHDLSDEKAPAVGELHFEQVTFLRAVYPRWWEWPGRSIDDRTAYVNMDLST